MKTLSVCKYAVHLMPTAAAGTFALNCAYLGIPCIGNKWIDTQANCHPNLSVDLYGGLERAKVYARRLKENEEFYKECSDQALKYYSILYSEEVWKKNFFNFLERV
jgi:hypothetical protein